MLVFCRTAWSLYVHKLGKENLSSFFYLLKVWKHFVLYSSAESGKFVCSHLILNSVRHICAALEYQSGKAANCAEPKKPQNSILVCNFINDKFHKTLPFLSMRHDISWLTRMPIMKRVIAYCSNYTWFPCFLYIVYITGQMVR